MMRKVSKHEALYLALLIICMTIGNLGLTRWTNFFSINSFRDKFIELMLIFFVITTIWGERKNILEHFFSISFLVLSYIVNTNVRGMYGDVVLLAGLMVVCAFRVDYKKAMIAGAIPMAVIWVVTVTSSLAGVITNKNWGGNGNSYDLGYRYCTYPAYMLFFLCLIYMICKESLKWYECAIIMAIQAIMYRITDTSATIVAMGIVIVIWIIYSLFERFFPRYDDRAWNVAIIAPAFMAVFSYLVQYLYDESNMTWLKINDHTVGRIGLGHNALLRYPHSLFGHYVRWFGVASMKSGREYNYVDNYYLKYGITYGIIYQMVILATLTYVIWKAVRYRKYVLVLSILAMLIFGIIDAEMVDIRFHPLILLITCASTIQEVKDEKIRI